MDIKKWILPILVVVLIGGYIVYRQFANNPAPVAAPVTNNNQSNTSGTTPVVTQTGYKDGQYTGAVANTIYGNVQVQTTISGGKITDIVFLELPNKPGHTTDLSNQSMPILKSEAIAAQSANVSVVSGATQTSQGFSQSLASALSQAM